MNDCIYISYSDTESNPNVKDFVIKIVSGKYSEQVDFYRKINGDSYKSFGIKLSTAKYIVCVLSDSYFRSDECMAQWFRIHENSENKKILYVKDDKEKINIGNEKLLKNGFDFNDKGRKYFSDLKDYWENYQNDCVINEQNGQENTSTAKFLKKHNYCLEELGKINNRINRNTLFLLSEGTKPIENAISHDLFLCQTDVANNDSQDTTSVTQSPHYDFFISTSSDDEEACRKILQLLRDQEISYWYFEEQRNHYNGNNWTKEIMNGIDNSSRILFLSSKHSNNSTDCINEISVSIKKKKPIIVVTLDNTRFSDELEYHLHHVDRINFKKPNWNERLKKIIEGDNRGGNIIRLIIIGFLISVGALYYYFICPLLHKEEQQYLGTVLVRCDKDVSTCVVRDGTTEIGPGAFEDCKKLKKVTLKHGLQTIASCAFKNCTALESIELPMSVCIINDFAFEGCESLKHFSFGGRHSKLQTVGSNPFVATKGIQMEEINNESICAKNGFLIDKTHKTLISYYGYEDSVFVPDDITTIGSNAFAYNYKIIKITLPEGITNIKYYAFKQCTNLENINIPNTLTELGTNPFVYDKKIKIRLDSNNQSFKYDERYKILIDRSKHLICCLDFINETLNLSLTDIVAINSSAFLGCNLKKIRLPLECKEISFDSFDTSKVNEIRVPTNNRQVILNALQNKKATERDYEKMCNIIKVYDE